MGRFELVLPPEVIEAVVQKVTALVLAQLPARQPEDRWLGVPEAAEYASVSRGTVYDAIKAGRLDAGRVGRSIRVRRSAVDAWLAWRR